LLGWLETQLRSDPYMALYGLRRARHHDRVLCLSERVGIPLAALRRAGAYRGGLGVLFNAWSHRQEAVMQRFGLFGAIDVVIVVSTALRDQFVALGVPADRVRVLRWAVDHRFFSPTDVPQDTFVLALGESRLRDYALLFSAMQGLPLGLRVLPRGYEYAREKRPATFRHRPANVTVLPRVAVTELRELYARSRFVVLPVHDVVYSAGVTAALEAMSMARAVIATRSRGLADYLVDGENCLLVEPGDAAALRDAICRLAADPELARRLGARGRQRVEAEINQVRYVEDLAALLSVPWTPSDREWTLDPPR
jgi:glycosyltransferase involved in cell wall biosynthesis